ncbi:galactose-binding domain-like protein, partial [Ochromonadaceae sp. CCMP2298]
MDTDFADLPNLASPQLGARIVFATDEWFAAADNMIADTEPVSNDDYTPFGKWMDGWENRRRRTEGHDWCIVKLGLPCVIKAIELDTGFFSGNFSPQASILGANLEPTSQSAKTMQLLVESRDAGAGSEFARMGLAATEEEMQRASSVDWGSWRTLVPLTPLGAGYPATRHNIFRVDAGVVTHLRVNMGPDGGIGRMRVYGQVVVSPSIFPTSPGRDMDLAAVQHGGQAVAFSNAHYGHPRNLIAPGRGLCMGDGWETARQPARPPVYQKGPDGLMLLPGCDWALLRLGCEGMLTSLEVDTNFYMGNYPESCMVETACLGDCSVEQLASPEQQQAAAGSGGWKVLLPRTRLGPSAKHMFHAADNQLNQVGPVTHLRLTTYPDGGVMRLRALGYKTSNATNSRL